MGVLESSLSKLRAHKWGVSNDHEALLEALSMERGQQNLSAEARKQWIKDILTQQREQVANLMEAQLESMVVGWLVRRNEESCAGKQLHQQSQPDAMSDSTGNINKDQQVVESDNQTLTEEKSRESEDEELAKELNDVLQLTPEQETQLKKVSWTRHTRIDTRLLSSSFVAHPIIVHYPIYPLKLTVVSGVDYICSLPME